MPTRSGSPARSAPVACPSAISPSITANARVGGRAQGRGVVPVAVLAREHQLEQRPVPGREGHVRRGRRRQPGVEGRARPVHGAVQVACEALEPVLRQRVEQRPAVGEVPARRGVADADGARELAQREPLGAALGQRALGLLEQRRAQVAVVVGPSGAVDHAPHPSRRS